MKANSSKTSSRDRPAPVRRRASRSFAPTSCALESRELLATSGLAPMPVAAPAFIGPVSPATLVLPLPAGASGESASTGVGREAGPGPGPDLPTPPGLPSPDGRPPSSHDRPRNRVGLAEADVLVDGKSTPEIAFADSARNRVVVKLGFNGPTTILSTAQGISNPGAMVLKDVNGDGLPDLVVANTGGNNVLVFAGLPGGGIGPELTGGLGFDVGQQPTGITVSDLNHDKVPDLIVANRGSNDVTILEGRGTGASWTLIPGQTLAAGASPVRTAIQDINLDGEPDLFILNSGSDDVTMYRGQGDGRFDPETAARFAVGLAPTELFVGRFDHRPGLDLVTVNGGSDSVSFIAGINTSSPQTMTFTSGGTQPDAAFAVDLNHDGVLDLVVANGGDGRVALLSGGSIGLQLAGVITRADLPAPTALAPDFVANARLDFFAAGAGQDAAQLLQFDLGPASDFLSIPPEASSSLDSTESELIAQLLPFGESGLELIAVFWEEDGASLSKTSVLEGHGASLSPVPCAKTDPERAEGERANGPANPSPVTLPPVDPASWLRYVTGTDLALGEVRDLFLTLAPMGDEDDAPGPRVLPEPPPIDPDLEAASEAIDEALRSLRSEGPAPAGTGPISDVGRVGLGTVDAPPRECCARSIPLVASSILLASRLILKASPPRPPSVRRGAWKRVDATGPRRDRPTRL